MICMKFYYFGIEIFINNFDISLYMSEVKGFFFFYTHVHFLNISLLDQRY